MHDIWPHAPVYTSVYLPEVMPPAYRGWDIRTSFMQRLPFLRTHFQKYLPLFPLAFEQFDFSDYDLVIDNSSAFSYGVITRPETCHISYCLTPARFLWTYHDYVRREGIGLGARFALAPFLTQLRVWDRSAADRVDAFIAISSLVQSRIRKFYRRESSIIFPPIECARFTVGTGDGDGRGPYFLVVSRLIPYKRIELAIRACRMIGARLKIVGSGRDRERLERLADGAPEIEFLGHVSDAELKDLWKNCRAFIFPGEEDFGISPLEAQAAGRPVIAYASGGALETVRDGETGVFFREPTVEALADVLSAFDARRYDPLRMRAHAETFDISVFRKRLTQSVSETFTAHNDSTRSTGRVY